MPEQGKTQKYMVRMPTESHTRLKMLATMRRRSLNAEINVAIDEYLARQPLDFRRNHAAPVPPAGEVGE